MTAAVLMNLGFAGGDNPPAYDQNTIVINAENETEYVHVGDPVSTRYKNPDDTHKVILDWSPWLGDSTISSVAWTSVPASLTFSNTSNTNQTATAYITGGSINEEFRVECEVTTADSPARVEARNFMLNIVRKWA